MKNINRLPVIGSVNGLVLLLILLLTLYVIPGSAQISQTKRVELPLEQSANYYYLMSAEERGLLAFRETKEKTAKGDYVWEFIQFDTSLNEQWKKNYTIDLNQEFVGYDYCQNNFYLLFKRGPYKDPDYTVLKFDLNDGDTSMFHIREIIPVELSDFNVVGNAAILSGQINNRAAVIHYDMSDKKIKVLPGLYKNHTEILQVTVDDENNTFNLINTERTINRKNTVSLKTFNENGELLRSDILVSPQDVSLISGASTSFDEENQLVAGTYAQDNSNYSRGFYIARLDEDGQRDLQQYNFGELENFFSYMKSKRQQRIKEKIAKRKKQGKKLRFNYRLLVHDILERDGNYILLAEAYYPKYDNESRSLMPYDYRNRNQLAEMNFTGYKYTHAIVVGFDKSGKLLWDNSFEINDLESYRLEKFVKVGVDQDKIVLLYVYENVVRSKIIRGNEVLEGKAFNDIKLKFEDDVVKNNDFKVGGLEKWYDKYFYVYGVQTIKSSRTVDKEGNRQVFFINKITYD